MAKIWEILTPPSYKRPTTPASRIVRTPATLPKSDALLGLEFEYDKTSHTPGYWEAHLEDEDVKSLSKWFVPHVDNSLRGDTATEFVFKRAFTVATTEKAIDELLRIAGTCDFGVSRRCGLHVHLNMGEATRDELRNLCALYAVMEPAIYHAAGGERSANPFCVPWFYDAYTSKMVAFTGNCARSDFRQIRRLKKYSGLNIKPLWAQGSIEFRHPRNTLDRYFIDRWLELIINLYEFSKRDDFERIFTNYVFEREDYRGLISAVYGKREVWEALMFPDMEEEINTTPIIIASEIFLNPKKYSVQGE